jgi:hypothetical protein
VLNAPKKRHVKSALVAYIRHHTARIGLPPTLRPQMSRCPSDQEVPIAVEFPQKSCKPSSPFSAESLAAFRTLVDVLSDALFVALSDVILQREIIKS